MLAALAALVATTSVGATAASSPGTARPGDGTPDLGPNVVLLDPSMSTAQV